MFSSTQQETLPSLCTFDAQNSYNERSSKHRKYWWEPGPQEAEPLLPATGNTVTSQVLLHPLKVAGEISTGLCHMLQRNHNHVLAKSRERSIKIVFQFTAEKKSSTGRFCISVSLLQMPYLKQISLPSSYRPYSYTNRVTDLNALLQVLVPVRPARSCRTWVQKVIHNPVSLKAL